MYDALRTLGHALAAPKRDPGTGAALARSSSSAGVAAAAPATADAFWAALKKVDEVAPHVPHSELLLAAKAEGLLRLGRLDRAREFCEQAVHLDEGGHRRRQQRAPWRLWIKAQCSWQDGDADGALKQHLADLMAELEQRERGAGGGGAGGGAAATAFFPADDAASSASFPAAEGETRCEEQLTAVVGLPSCAEVRALLEGLEKADALRQAGNAAVRAGRAAEAVQKYSEALAVGCLSPLIAAVLLSNRAAAHQHLKQRAQVGGGRAGRGLQPSLPRPALQSVTGRSTGCLP
jgi:tetratricopeptide (TPR) repeat protein